MKYPFQESSTLELKEEIPKNDQILKTVIGFSNQGGGKLIVGVAKDGTVVGVPEPEIAHALESLSQAIYEASAPPIIPLVYTQTIGEKVLVIIEVSAGMHKPYYRKSEGLEYGTYVRLGRSTLRANADLIEELKWQSRGKSYDTMPVYEAQEKDLDLEKIERFLRSRKGNQLDQINLDVLLSYYIVTQEHSQTYPTPTGLLLFGKNPQHFFSEAFILCSHFKGTEGRETIASVDCTGTLFQQFEAAMDFIVSKLSYSFTIDGLRRKDVLEIPPEALREALLNAIVHRNYHLKSSVKVAIYQNRIEIFSPGTLPALFNLQNLKLGLSFIRNIGICKVFREAGYIEKLGSGLLTMFRSYEAMNLKSPTIFEGENFVKYILPREKASTMVAEDLQSLFDLFHTSAHLTISDLVKLLHISRATAHRKLHTLIKQGAIEQIGKGRSTRYRLK